VYRFFVQVAAGSLLLGGGLEWFRSTILSTLDRTTFVGCMASALATGLVFAVILTVIGYGLKIPEITGLVSRVAGKFK
jgi:hypothetical protein